MFIKRTKRSAQAYTLVEMMFGVGVFSIAAMGLAIITLFSVRSFAALANYAVLDQYNRVAMDTVTYELRQAKQITGYSSNATTRSLTLLSGDNQTVTYTFDSTKQQVRRSVDGATKVLLTNCNLLNFNLYMRPPPTNATFDFYPVNYGDTNWQQWVKVVQLSWKTGMRICPTPVVNSEDIQTACVVIRKQQDN
jgi:hypothetical protein